jgi:hypothetical protein
VAPQLWLQKLTTQLLLVREEQEECFHSPPQLLARTVRMALRVVLSEFQQVEAMERSNQILDSLHLELVKQETLAAISLPVQMASRIVTAIEAVAAQALVRTDM